jgi:hypothetical protein
MSSEKLLYAPLCVGEALASLFGGRPAFAEAAPAYAKPALRRA